MPKQYETRIRLGAISNTDDADGEVIESPATSIPAFALVESALPAFVGNILQLPPQFSALKVQGQRAYDLARRGTEVALQPRPVRVDSIVLLRYEWPWVDLLIDCGKGTYIRSIARDLGAVLGVGGLVQTREISKPPEAEKAARDSGSSSPSSAFRPINENGRSNRLIL